MFDEHTLRHLTAYPEICRLLGTRTLRICSQLLVDSDAKVVVVVAEVAFASLFELVAKIFRTPVFFLEQRAAGGNDVYCLRPNPNDPLVVERTIFVPVFQVYWVRRMHESQMALGL